MSRLPIMRRSHMPLLAIAAAFLCHFLLWDGFPLLLRASGALVLAALLPGLLLVEALVGRSDATLGAWERILYSLGAGYGVMVLTMLAVSYLPGPVARWQTVAAFDLLLLVLAGILWFLPHRQPVEDAAWSKLPSPTQCRPLLAGFLVLLLVGAGLRFVNLNYSEFQGDEARAVLRAAAVIQGYEDVLMVHKKGPAEILIPTVLYSMTGGLTEATARLPFALANLAGLFALWVLGWRLFGPVAGWSAALLLALDGYFIGFSRIVQYQSVVFLTTVLVVLILYRLVCTPRALSSYLTLAALLLVTGLLSHYEAFLAVVPAIYLLALLARRNRYGLSRLTRSLSWPLLVGGISLAAFYLPFVLHPNFQATYSYVTGNRIGGSFPYNNLADFFLRTTLYSTTYYVVLLTVLTAVALALAFVRAVGRRGLLVVTLLLVACAAAIWQPRWFIVGESDFVFLPFAAALVAVWVLPRVSVAQRLLWLWFAVPFLVALFFTAKPRTHVYVFFMPWVLLAGMVIEQGWREVAVRTGQARAVVVGVAATSAVILLFGLYAYWYFVYNGVEILNSWEENRPPGYWTAYDTPDYSSIFGFPHQDGWKAVGVLYQSGLLQGPYGTNEDDEWVREWYTRGRAVRCERAPDTYILEGNFEHPEPEGEASLTGRLQGEYQLAGTVLIREQPRLQIYQRGEQPLRVQERDITELATYFDSYLSGPELKVNPPVVAPTIDNPLRYRLGERIWLEGYDVEQDHVRPGESVTLTLYWRTTGEIEESYTVFNHIADPGVAMYGQLDGLPGCESAPTDGWEPGELIVDRYTIPIFPDARPGRYPLLTGMYHFERGERLPVYDEHGHPVGDAVELTQITVEPVH